MHIFSKNLCIFSLSSVGFFSVFFMYFYCLHNFFIYTYIQTCVCTCISMFVSILFFCFFVRKYRNLFFVYTQQVYCYCTFWLKACECLFVVFSAVIIMRMKKLEILDFYGVLNVSLFIFTIIVVSCSCCYSDWFQNRDAKLTNVLREYNEISVIWQLYLF